VNGNVTATLDADLSYSQRSFLIVIKVAKKLGVLSR